MSATTTIRSLLDEVIDVITLAEDVKTTMQGKSYADTNRLATLEPFCIYSRDLTHEPYMYDIQQLSMSIFISYYLLAVETVADVDRAQVTKILSSVNPEVGLEAYSQPLIDLTELPILAVEARGGKKRRRDRRKQRRDNGQSGGSGATGNGSGRNGGNGGGGSGGTGGSGTGGSGGGGGTGGSGTGGSGSGRNGGGGTGGNGGGGNGGRNGGGGTGGSGGGRNGGRNGGGGSNRNNNNNRNNNGGGGGSRERQREVDEGDYAGVKEISARVTENKGITAIGKQVTISITKRGVNSRGKKHKAREIQTFVKLINVPIDNGVLEGQLTLSRKDNSFGERWMKMRAGRIKFWEDLVFAEDLINEERRLLAHPDSAVFSKLKERHRAGLLKTARDKGDSYGVGSNIVIISQEVLNNVERKSKHSITNGTMLNDMFTSLGFMMLVVVDREEEMVTLYFKNINQGSVHTIASISKQNGGSSDGPDIISMIRDLSKSDVPNF